MAQDSFPYQPGPILYAAVMGALRNSGQTFEGWAMNNSMLPTSVRYAIYGISDGPKGRAVRARIIADAGEDVVRAGYLAGMRREFAALERELAK